MPPGHPNFGERTTPAYALGHSYRVLDGPFRGSAALASRVLTEGVLRGPRFRRVFPDVYVPAELELNLTVRSRAAHLWLDGRGMLAGYSSAELFGAPCAPRDAPAEAVVPGLHLHPPPGLVLRKDVLREQEWCRYQGLALTTPLRTAYDLARRRELVEAVVALDALAARFRFAPAEVLTIADRHPGARRRRRLPEIVELADPRSSSPMESRLRLVLVRAGLPKPAVQHPVTDRVGRTVATVDLAYQAERIAIEYEGGEHFERERVIRDVYRYTRLVDLGWRVYRYTAKQVYWRPEQIVAEIDRARRARVSA